MRYLTTKRGAQLSAVLAAIAILVLSLCACTATPVSSESTAAVNPNASTASAPEQSSASDFVSAVQAVMPSMVKVEVTFGSQGAPSDPQASGAAGTGWVIKSDGLIATNDHVVDGAQSITVIFADGTKYTVSGVQSDKSKDLAILKINAQNLTAATTGDSSQLKLGQPVAAVGNALNLGIRVTVGVVSQLDVPVSYDSISLTGLIETDAAINPGNSGGALITLDGQVVGITNAGLYDPSLDVENFGYAISMNEATPVLNTLISQS